MRPDPADVRDQNREGAVRAPFGQIDEVELRVHAARATQQAQCLVHHVTAEIPEQPAVRAGIKRGGVVEVEAGLHPPQLTDHAPPQDARQGADVGVPSSVVEDAERQARLLGRSHQIPARLRRWRERLVGDHVHPAGKGLQDQLAARLRWRSDRDGVHSEGEKVGQRIEHRHARVIDSNLGATLRRPGDHARQLHPVGGDGERSVEEPPALPVPD
jgi:hypothetical protein